MRTEPGYIVMTFVAADSVAGPVGFIAYVTREKDAASGTW